MRNLRTISFQYSSPTQAKKASVVLGVVIFSAVMITAIFLTGDALRNMIVAVTFLPRNVANLASFLLLGVFFWLCFSGTLFWSTAWPWYRSGAFTLEISDFEIKIAAGAVVRTINPAEVLHVSLVRGPVDARQWSRMSSRFDGTGIVFTIKKNDGSEKLLLPLTHKRRLPNDTETKLIQKLAALGINITEA